MKSLIFTLAAMLLFPALALGGEKEEAYLKETMIPLAREFFQRIGQTNELPSTADQIKKYRVNYFDDRPGCMADMRLTNGCVFSFHTEKKQTAIWAFNRPVKTYYELDNAPKEKVEALKALNLRNKLNKKSALVLASKYLKLLGHKDENFHLPDITQGYWVSSPESPPIEERHLPYYEITWYRKDVDLAELKNGNSNSKSVIVEVSGIDSALVSYTKTMMPIGSDF